MKRFLTVLAISGFCFSPVLASAKNVVVKMVSLGYDPATIQIAPGDTITWKNVAHTEHSVVSEDKSFNFSTGMVQPGKESKPVTFANPGEFKYHCGLHGTTMSGVVEVKAAQK